MPTTLHRPPVLVTLLTVTLLALSLASCGGDDSSAATRGPVASTTLRPTSGLAAEFDRLPTMPLANPVGTRGGDDGAVLQSFAVRGRTPEAVVAFFDEALPPAGWRRAELAPTGPGSPAATYERPGRLLRLTTSAAPTLDESSGVSIYVTQYSLELRAI